MQTILTETRRLLEVLEHPEEPFGTMYTDNEPEDGYGPKEAVPIARAMADPAKVNREEIFSNFSCLIGNVWLARKKQAPAYIAEHKYGCLGGSFYCGFPSSPVQRTAIAHYVSSGSDAMGKGERYFWSPDGVRRFQDAIVPPAAPARYCVTKPLSLFTPEEEPLLVTFFARGEVIGGLTTLVCYTTDDYGSVVAPFGSGCGSMVGWPLRLQSEGRECAVLGVSDPSCRKFVKTDEQLFTVPFNLYKRMLSAAPESLLYRDTWQGVRKKVLRSRKAWGEE